MKKYSFIFYLNKKIRGQQLVTDKNGWILSSTKNSFFTFHLRPKYAYDVKNSVYSSKYLSNIAIIIQGPIQLKENFTLETIKLYKIIYPEAKVILSTWRGENEKSILKAKEYGAEVILNKKPNDYGYGQKASSYNLNLQLISTKEGISLAKKLNYKYSIKTRTDMRLYKPNIFGFFISMMNLFPLENAKLQDKRIFVSSIATCKYRIYGLTDVLMFGKTKDMLNYWNVDFYEEGIKDLISINQILKYLQ